MLLSATQPDGSAPPLQALVPESLPLPLVKTVLIEGIAGHGDIHTLGADRAGGNCPRPAQRSLSMKVRQWVVRV